jgi:hypothetical protein
MLVAKEAEMRGYNGSEASVWLQGCCGQRSRNEQVARAPREPRVPSSANLASAVYACNHLNNPCVVMQG